MIHGFRRAIRTTRRVGGVRWIGDKIVVRNGDTLASGAYTVPQFVLSLTREMVSGQRTAMKVTTVRFGTDLWRLLEAEAGYAGVSVSQYIREAALARAASAVRRRRT